MSNNNSDTKVVRKKYSPQFKDQALESLFCIHGGYS